MTRARAALVVSLFLAAGPWAGRVSAGQSAADAGWEDVRLSGGVDAVARAAGVTLSPQRSLLLVELIRRLYGTTSLTDPAASTIRTRVAEALAARAAAGASSGPASNETGGAGAGTAPMRLPGAFWSAVVFGGRVPPSDVAVALLTDRRAGLFYHGVAALDPSTAAWLASDPARAARLFDRHAEVFAAFGRSLHVDGGRMLTPGGDGAAETWQTLVGAPVTAPDQFIDQLFSRDGGRRAWFYDVVAHLPPDVQQHVLGNRFAAAGVRVERLRALADVFARVTPSWRIAERPLWRPLIDPAVWLGELRMRSDGALAGPLTVPLVDAAFAAGAPRSETAAAALAGEPIDAAALAARVFLADPARVRDRMVLTLFAQRVFGDVPPAALSDALAVCRAVEHAPALALSLERMGIEDPAVLAAIVRQADDLTHRGSPASVASLQGALGLVEAVRLARTIDVGTATRVLRELAGVPFLEPRFHQPLARWVRDVFVPALGPSPSTAPLEARLLDAMAGRASGPGAVADSPQVEWEGQRYLVDARAAERVRLDAVRAAQGGLSLDDAVALALAADGLIAPDAAGVETAERALAQAAPALRPASAPRASSRTGRSASDEAAARQLAAAIADARDTLRVARERADYRGVPRLAHTLAGVSSRLLADSLAALVYAAALPAGDGVAETARLHLRHEFGAGAALPESRFEAPWTFAEPVSGGGGPWRLRGSLLALDLALAPQRLRRLSDEPPRPTLHGADRDAILATVPLVNPFDLDDASRDAIVAILARGSSRLAAAADAAVREPGAVRAAARAAGLSEWRVEALARPGVPPPDVVAAFSLTERFWLGAPDALQTAAADRWGVSLTSVTGQLATRLPRARAWEDLAGHWGGGLLAGQMADLNLRVAQQLAELALPAELARDVLSVAVQDLLDRVVVATPDDHPALVAYVRDLSKARFEDYVAALTVEGPLRPTPDEEQP